MNLDSLKEKLTESEFSQLQAHVTTLTEQRDFAKQEQITSRKSLKAEVEALRKTKEILFDKLNLEDDADLSTVVIPSKGAELEATKQAERRLKKLELELAAEREARTGLETKHRSTLMDAQLQKAIAAHEFVDTDLVSEYIKGRVKFENDELIFVDGDKTLSIDEGVKLVASSKPHLLKSQGQGGSGFNPNSTSGKTKGFNEMTLAEKGELYKASPEKYNALKQAA